MLAATGGNVNLWKAVKIAKNLNLDRVPLNLTLGGIPVAPGQAAESFGGHFSDKVKENVDNNLRRYGVPHRVESISSITIFFSQK